MNTLPNANIHTQKYWWSQNFGLGHILFNVLSTYLVLMVKDKDRRRQATYKLNDKDRRRHD